MFGDIFSCGWPLLTSKSSSESRSQQTIVQYLNRQRIFLCLVNKGSSVGLAFPRSCRHIWQKHVEVHESSSAQYLVKKMGDDSTAVSYSGFGYHVSPAAKEESRKRKEMLSQKAGAKQSRKFKKFKADCILEWAVKIPGVWWFK